MSLVKHIIQHVIFLHAIVVILVGSIFNEWLSIWSFSCVACFWSWFVHLYNVVLHFCVRM